MQFAILPFLQTAIMKGKQAVVCDSEPIKCPLGHDTCKVINASIAVGNDSYQNPEVAQFEGLSRTAL